MNSSIIDQMVEPQALAGSVNNPSAGWNFESSYARLPQVFHFSVHPVPVSMPRLAVLNRPLAGMLGLDMPALEGASGVAMFAGNFLPEGVNPISQAYAGHQFGHFAMLGDGRAVLLGEHISPEGIRRDIQLKGSGPTPYSRRGDGRAALGPMLREYIISEAMHALDIPTTRSLAVALTGEPVFRQDRLTGAILTRVAASHIRVGTFQYAAATGNVGDLRALADYTIARHYPDLSGAINPYLALLHAVIEKQASLISKWMQVGFIHGVMNTDNMAISGETIDYGPCAFMDAYHPDTVFSSIDHDGRYAYANQPHIAQWNLARFAETLLPLLDGDQNQAVQMAEQAIHAFPEIYHQDWLAGFRAKLGLCNSEDDDLSLVQDLLTAMQRSGADFTNTFRDLSSDDAANLVTRQNPSFLQWYDRWQARVNRQPGGVQKVRAMMRRYNPAVIPRNHLVEEALAAADGQGDFSVMEQLLAILSKPHDAPDSPSVYGMPPAPSGQIYQTYCGT